MQLRDRRIEAAVGLDVFFVVLFAAIGRRTHDQSGAFVAVLDTAGPFLIGLAAAWLVTRAWRRPMRLSTGLLIWPTTVLGGMIARRTIFDETTATSFVIVTTLFLGACFVGWRAVLRLVERRRSAPTLSRRRVSI